MARLRIGIGGEEFHALLLENKAPKTCDAILTRLPINGRVIHARWSGEAVWMSMDTHAIEVGFENQTFCPSPGEILFYPGFISEREILIPYGPSRFGSRAGTLAGNHFATISEGLAGLADVGRSILWEGAKSIRIEEVQ